MDGVLALRPFVPSKDFQVSLAFYEALGFQVAHKNSSIAVLKLGEFGFVLQNFYVQEHATNTMVQLLVRDVDTWWASSLDAAALVAKFGVKQPIPPTMQHWGLRVGFVFDPSGVLWHIAQIPS